jgi:hypothetical protein
MADDDDDDVIESPEEFDDAEEADDEPADIDVDDLDEDSLEDDLEENFDDDEFADDDETESDDEAAAGPVRRSVVGEDEDEDEDLVTPDDVEADLDTILKDRLVASDEEGEDEEEEPEERGDTMDRIQPKRADEELCPKCFLLVRHSAPVCPVGDDDCPFFS